MYNKNAFFQQSMFQNLPKFGLDIFHSKEFTIRILKILLQYTYRYMLWEELKEFLSLCVIPDIHITSMDDGMNSKSLQFSLNSQSTNSNNPLKRYLIENFTDRVIVDNFEDSTLLHLVALSDIDLIFDTSLFRKFILEDGMNIFAKNSKR